MLLPFSGCAIYQTVWLQNENAVMLGMNVATDSHVISKFNIRLDISIHTLVNQFVLVIEI